MRFKKNKSAFIVQPSLRRGRETEKKRINGLFKCANEADVQITASSSIWNRDGNTDGAEDTVGADRWGQSFWEQWEALIILLTFNQGRRPGDTSDTLLLLSRERPSVDVMEPIKGRLQDKVSRVVFLRHSAQKL